MTAIAPELTSIHEPRRGFVSSYVFSTDHKVVGIQYLFFGFTMMLVAGLLAMLIRWQLAFQGRPIPALGKLFPQGMPGGIMMPEFYNSLFTMHATIMIFFGIMPVLVGAFANFLIPLQIGARDMAFPRLNMVSFWIAVPAGLVILAGFWATGGAASSGWTSYPPLSSTTLGRGQTLWVVAIALIGVSSTLGAVNYVTTILNMRAPGMTLFRMPLTTWSLLITSVIMLLAIPVLTAAALMLLADRSFGTSFFTPHATDAAGYAVGGQPLLWQHLFWFFGHPEVYIMILPAMGITSDVLSVFSRKPVFGYRAMAWSMTAIAVLGFIVWGHHMFQSGMNPVLGSTFAISTMVIAAPSGIKTFNWLGTLWRGNIRLTVPMLHALAFVSMFVIGGLSGIFMASTPVDIFIHDTYFIVAHIHYVLFGGSMFAIFAGTTYWFPKMFGKMPNETLGRIHFLVTFVAFNGVMFPMHILGVRGMPRRIFDYRQYAHLADLQGMNEFMTWSAFALGAAQLLFAFNVFWSMKFGREAEANPWLANTLEWSVHRPGHGNFAVIPTVHRGPYEYSVPGLEADYLPQDLDPQPHERAAAGVTA